MTCFPSRALRAITIGAAALAPASITAHGAERPTPETIWAAWNLDPVIMVSLLVSGWLYLRGARVLRERGGRSLTGWHTVAFIGGLGLLAIATLTPLDALSGALFSAHMGQHLLIFLVGPMLMAAGRPRLPMLWALPSGWRRRVGLAIARVARTAAGHWVTILMLFAGVLWLWHVPAFYDGALATEAMHGVEHITFAVTAFLFWSVILGAGGSAGEGHGVALLMVFATALHSSALGALLTFADRLLYESHAPYTEAWGLTPIEDQQLAGVLMWVPMGLWFTVVALALVGAWIGAAGRSVDRAERPRAPQPGVVASLAWDRPPAPEGEAP